MTILIAIPHCDLVESAFEQIHGTNMQIHKYKNGLQDILTPSTSLPKQIERCRGVNRKHASAESGICYLAFKHHRKIPNFTLCRGVFALKAAMFLFICYILHWEANILEKTFSRKGGTFSKIQYAWYFVWNL